MPILGIIASSLLQNIDTGVMDPLQVITVGPSGAANVEFTSIPATYSHLQIRGIVKVDRSNGNGDLQIRFNSDTGSNYAYHRLLGNGTSAVADGAGTTNGFIAYPVGDYTNANNVFTGFVCDILDYANANKYKTVRTLSGMDQNGLTAPNGDVGRVMLVSALWQNTNAITSIQLIDPSNSLRPYSSFALYGIKGAV